MARHASQNPTELELEILKIIWRDGPSTARHVRDTLASTRDLAITTIATMLNKMVAKGQLERRERSKGQGGILYAATITQKKTCSRYVLDLKRRIFGGSTASVMQHLLDVSDLKREELADLRKLIEQREKAQED